MMRQALNANGGTVNHTIRLIYLAVSKQDDGRGDRTFDRGACGRFTVRASLNLRSVVPPGVSKAAPAASHRPNGLTHNTFRRSAALHGPWCG